MYTVYTHTTTATGASVVEDLAELIKGEVVVASLPVLLLEKLKHQQQLLMFLLTPPRG